MQDTLQATVITQLWSMRGRLRTWTNVASSLGLSVVYVTQVVRGLRKPGPKMLQALGIEKMEIAVTTNVSTTEPTADAGEAQK